MLQHLHNGWQVDQAILSEEDRVVVIRFGHDWDPTCMVMDETLYRYMITFCYFLPILVYNKNLLFVVVSFSLILFTFIHFTNVIYVLISISYNDKL
jgi:hypothetical protein